MSKSKKHDRDNSSKIRINDKSKEERNGVTSSATS